jgi:hypothetical protein
MTDQSETAPRLEDEVVTTAHTPRTERTDRLATGSRDAAEQPEPSVMREWVNELTGRVDRASTGIRVPTEEEISQLMGIFPDLQRDVIVAALQRRWVHLISGVSRPNDRMQSQYRRSSRDAPQCFMNAGHTRIPLATHCHRER